MVTGSSVGERETPFLLRWGGILCGPFRISGDEGPANFLDVAGLEGRGPKKTPNLLFLPGSREVRASRSSNNLRS